MATTTPTTVPVGDDPAAAAGSTADVTSRRGSPTASLGRAAATAGPVLLLGSSVAWAVGPDVAELRGSLQFWAFPFLGLALMGIATRLEVPAPRARAVLTAMFAIGMVAGGSFAQEILMVDHFGTERLLRQPTPSALLALGIPGVLLPIGTTVMGLMALVHRALPPKVCLLMAAGGLMFPMSRIPELAGLAIAADLVLLVALVAASRASSAAAP